VKNEAFEKLGDAKWYEKVTTVLLILAIVGMGVAPLWLSNVINDSLQPIIDKLALLG
jgi:NADH-quinone oxidoreductase subunit M